jgi:monofunctional glycosyltransferase
MDDCISSAGEPGQKSRYWKYAILVFLAFLLTLIIGSILVSIRDVSSLRTENPIETALMRYRDEQSRETKRKRLRRQAWTPLSHISNQLIQAVLISEDDKFFQHDGFDWEGIKVAMEKNIDRRRWSSGGSTITQQLAKNLYLNPSKNPFRKLREAVLAVQMETALSKKRILELYLNVIEWGDGVYGIGAASEYYFNNSPAQINAAQAIRLASVLPNPLRYSPLLDNNKRMRTQRLLLAERMFRRQVIDEALYQQLYAEFSGDSGTNP